MDRPRMWLFLVGLIACIAPGPGCAVGDRRVVSPNPLMIPAGDFETVWNRTVRVVDDYFEIESENRLARRIETKPEGATTLLEPWGANSVGMRDRTEATLQPIRKFAIVNVEPTTAGGWAVKVEVYKELEDVAGASDAALATAPFQNELLLHTTPEFSYSPGSRQSSRWISRGRDTKLEQVILNRIRESLFL